MEVHSVHLLVTMITTIVPNPTRMTFVIYNKENKGEMSARLLAGIFRIL